MSNQIKNGLKYGYPMCCILWFETGYNCMRRKGGLFSIIGKRNLNEWHAVDERIMCPSCLLKKLSRSLIQKLFVRCIQ